MTIFDDYTTREYAEMLLAAARVSNEVGQHQEEVVYNASPNTLAMTGIGYALLAILEKLDALNDNLQAIAWAQGIEFESPSAKRSQVIATDGGTVSGVHQSIG